MLPEYIINGRCGGSRPLSWFDSGCSDYLARG
nr:MAG TPA: hypothetical protein [Caudoviricetes sp.]